MVWVRGNPAQIATLVCGDTQIAYGGATTALGGSGRRARYDNHRQSEQPRESLDLVCAPNIKSSKELAASDSATKRRRCVWKTATVWLEHSAWDERRDNIQMTSSVMSRSSLSRSNRAHRSSRLCRLFLAAA